MEQVFTIKTKTNNLDYLIDPKLFVLSLKDVNDNPTRNSFDGYYMSITALVENKPFFELASKKKKYCNVAMLLIVMSRKNDYTTRNLLDNLYHEKYYTLIWYRFIKANKCEYSSTN